MVCIYSACWFICCCFYCVMLLMLMLMRIHQRMSALVGWDSRVTLCAKHQRLNGYCHYSLS